MASRAVHLSKLLSLVLRHRPDELGLVLDAGGWVEVDDLRAALAARGEVVSAADLTELVRTSDKQRFALSSDGRRIRAQQGHSVPVELGYAPAAPPEVLFHGTVARFLPSIRTRGLLKGRRHHVHLSETEDTASRVGGRRGAPVVLRVRAAEMAAAGHAFFQTPNRVWLTDHVPPGFIDGAGPVTGHPPAGE